MDLNAERPLLWGIAYRMTGDAAEADDIVQDVCVRALERPPLDVERPLRPWLVSVALNLSRDRLRARKRRVYAGPWLPSPVLDAELADAKIERRQSASMAFLLAAEALTPTQRAAWLCKEVLDYSSAETANMLGISVGGVDVAVHKARSRLSTLQPNDSGPMADTVALAFLGALSLGMTSAAARLIAPNAVCINDGAGKVHAARVPIRGPRKIATAMIRLQRLEHGRLSWKVLRCNGLLTLVFERPAPDAHQSTHFTLAIEVRKGKITALYTVLVPERILRVVG